MRELNQGRWAALLYLFNSAPGFFSYMIVTPALIVPGDAAATGHNILSSPLLFRLGILSEIVSSIALIFLVLALYRLFRSVDHGKAVTMVVLVLVSIPVSLLNVVNDVAVLRLLTGGESVALAMLFVRLHGAGIQVA